MSGGEDGGVMSARVLCCDELCIMRRNAMREANEARRFTG